MTWSSLVMQDIDNCAFPQHQSELPRSASSSSMIMARRRELLGLFSVFVLVVSAFFYIPSLLTIIVYSCQLRHLQALFQGSFGCATFCGGREIAAVPRPRSNSSKKSMWQWWHHSNMKQLYWLSTHIRTEFKWYANDQNMAQSPSDNKVALLGEGEKGPWTLHDLTDHSQTSSKNGNLFCKYHQIFKQI